MKAGVAEAIVERLKRDRTSLRARTLNRCNTQLYVRGVTGEFTGEYRFL
jgi:hypothetical protein